jgi:tetratricopeptide (TPR) repeat protein
MAQGYFVEALFDFSLAIKIEDKREEKVNNF